MEINDLIGILVEQNKSFIEQNKNYKDTLFWAVTSIITILVIFLTANFFTMAKIRKNEIEKIKTEIITDIKTNSFPELKQELNKNLESLVEEKFMSLESKINKLRSTLELTERRLERSTKDFENDILPLQGLIYELEGDLYNERERTPDAFQSYLRAGNIYIKTNKGYTDSILRSLERTATDLPYIIRSQIKDFNNFANKLDPQYQTQVDKISAILKEKKTL